MLKNGTISPSKANRHERYWKHCWINTPENIEDMKILTVNPLEIVKFFGGKKQYLKALTELEQEIYRKAA